MNACNRRNKRIISFLSLMAIVFSLFAGLHFDIDTVEDFSLAGSEVVNAAGWHDYILIANAKEITLISAKEALVRHSVAKKILSGIYRAFVTYSISYVFGSACLVCLVTLLCVKNISHRYILLFIHNTDGQKA